MTRPIRPAAPFNAVLAPSRSRPQLPGKAVLADVRQARELAGASGIVALTEIKRAAAKAAVRAVFGPNRVGLRVADCPIAWTPDFRKVDGGVDFGSAGIPIVAPTRWTAWAILERGDGLKVGVVSTHMHPGGFARRPSHAQADARPTIKRRWYRHAARIQHRIDQLVAAGCDVVVVMGDINRPDGFTWHGVTRETEDGLLYVGVTERGVQAIGHHHPRKQNADHSAECITIAPKETP
jgi:hypothetical protein